VTPGWRRALSAQGRPQRGFAARGAHGFVLLPVVLALTLVASVAFLLNHSGGMNMSMAGREGQADRARYVAQAGLAQINAQTQARNCSGYTDLAATAFGPHSFSATVNPKAGTPVTLTATSTTAEGASVSLSRAIVAHQTTPQTATLQPGPAGMDSYVRVVQSSRNFGAETTLRLSTASEYALLQFDLASIPAGSQVTAAQLTLHQQNSTGGAGAKMSVHRVTRPWVEGTKSGSGTADGVTWSTTDGATAWTATVGDRESVPLATIAADTESGLKTWDVTALAAAWLSGAFSNQGMVVIPSAGVNNLKFTSGDDPDDPTLWPKLTVTYLPPCGS